MAEIGFVTCARVARRVGQAVLSASRSQFSKHRFPQPPLLAMLCLIRDEDWTFREAEVRLDEQRELRAALGLTQALEFTTLDRFRRRLDAAVIAQALTVAVRQRPAPPEECSTTGTVQATGLAPGAISTFFGTRAKDHGEGFTWRHWLQSTVTMNIGRRLVVAQAARCGPYNDGATLRPLVKAASQRVPIGLVLTEAAFDRERNHQYIRHYIGADSIIPAKWGKANWPMTGIRAHMYQQFPAERYRQRAGRKPLLFGQTEALHAGSRARSIHTPRMQALLRGLAYDIYRL
jgi:hypothetical protein